MNLKSFARRYLPDLYWWLYYRHGLGKIAIPQAQADALLAGMVADCAGKPCLQIGVKETHVTRFGPNWTTVDKFDMTPRIDRHDDIHDLKFADGYFDAAVCISILEHVDNPWRAVSELVRVLRPGGLLWLQSPMAYPYHPDPLDLWRFTPDGLALLAKNCAILRRGAFRFTRSPLVASSFVYGQKL